jgi:hypothetical protein
VYLWVFVFLFLFCEALALDGVDVHIMAFLRVQAT